MGDNSCVVCGVREAADSYVCTFDQQRLDQQLGQLGDRVGRLTTELAPTAGTAMAGERVNHTRATAAPPTRIDVLTMLGPGTDRITAVAMAGGLSPWVRRWRTVETVTVTGRDGHDHEQEVVTWHQELADETLVTYSNTSDIDATTRRPREPGMTPILHNDQAGLVPPAPWAHSWARRWREHLGHHRRPVRYARGGDQDAANRYIREHLDGRERERIAASLLGLTGRHPAATPDDPAADRWHTRFGEPGPGYSLTHDLRYLQRWLGPACEQDLDIALFAVQLRALAEELARVLGDHPDQHWLGRCPATLTSHDGSRRTCGAGIWQDPYASQVTCLRCRSTWGPAKADLIGLAAAIRDVWPVDRRRRYTATEIRFLPQLFCETCRFAVTVQWKEVTGRGETTRSWQPTGVTCQFGCDTTRMI